MSKWLAGKKTYLLAAFVGLVLLILVCAGKLTPGLALDILVFSAPCFAATFRDTLQNNHSQVLTALTDLAKVGVDLKSHRTGALLEDGQELIAATTQIHLATTTTASTTEITATAAVKET